jgi:hypothetical protein
VYQGVSLRVDAWQCARTYGVQRPDKTSGSYNRSLCRAAPVLSLYTRPDCSSGWCMPCIRAARFSGVLLALGGGLVLFVPCGGGRLPDRRRHPIDAVTEAVTECGSPAAGWKTCTVPCERRCWRIWTLHERGRHVARGSRCSLRDSIWLSR